MTATVKRPDYVTDEHLEFLDELREGGSINMFGAAPELADEFDITKQDARKILSYWMESFGNEGR
jgi:uncharacterized protein YciI